MKKDTLSEKESFLPLGERVERGVTGKIAGKIGILPKGEASKACFHRWRETLSLFSSLPFYLSPFPSPDFFQSLPLSLFKIQKK
ncbi:MAG: hypothetical protein C6I01_06260 [Epsilonproteobacteria bacterium]|nr:hypothetical protein [Campylobacterota bacterium]